MIQKIKKIWIMALLALMLGITAALLSHKLVQDRLREIDNQAKLGQEMIEVMVANVDLSQGSVLGPEVLAVRKIPKQYAHSTVFTPEQLLDIDKSRLQSSILRGETILHSHIDGIGQRIFSTILQKGKRALTFEVDEISSTAGMLRPGDRVDLIYSVKENGVNEVKESHVLPLLSNLSILATGQSVSKQDTSGTGKNFSNITLEVSPEEASKILLAKSSGEITAILRNPDDQAPNESAPITPGELLASLHKKPLLEALISKAKNIEYLIGGSGDNINTPGDLK